jgi:hypothetical protein
MGKSEDKNQSHQKRSLHPTHHRQLRRRARGGVETVLLAINILLAPPSDGEDVRAQVSQRVGLEHLHEAAQSCREFQRLEERGQLDELCARYTNLRRYLPAFFSLPFAGEKGSEELLAALRLLRRLDARKIEELPKDAPCHFIPAAWRAALYREDGNLDRRIWVIALSQAVRDALRAGDLNLPGSRHHVSFWKLVYDEERWAAERKRVYGALVLPAEAEAVLGRLAAGVHRHGRTCGARIGRKPVRFGVRREVATEGADRSRVPRATWRGGFFVDTGDSDRRCYVDRREQAGRRSLITLEIRRHEPHWPSAIILRRPALRLRD